MPRKPKPPSKATIQVVVNGKPVAATLHPPTESRKTWYVYWPGLKFSKSTGQTELADAIVAAENMIKTGGQKTTVADTILSDQEFVAIQRAHFGRKRDPNDQQRAEKTLKACQEAIDAFKEITGLSPIALATADDCAAFQRKSLSLPKNWRQQHPKSKKDVRCLSANTVLKWSRSLQAAFERVNKNAGKKCVRGVVDESKLTTENPWNQFDWAVDEVRKEIRQLSSEELLSFLDYLGDTWPEVTTAMTLAKVYLWSACRQAEATSLTWDAERNIGEEHHFQVVGKWGVERWFRVPDGLYRELKEIKTGNPYVFAAYPEQLRLLHQRQGRLDRANMVGTEFKPLSLGDWFYDRLVDWSAAQAVSHVSPHVFRKTSLQFARIGEDVNLEIAHDAKVSAAVLTYHYVKETDEQLRQKSNRTYRRILAGLPSEVAKRHGYTDIHDGLEEKVKAALAERDWPLAAALTAQLAKQRKPATG